MEKPFKTYNGGKSSPGTYQNIINHIPKCNVFVDGMVGGGGIFFNLNLQNLTIINDLDLKCIKKYEPYTNKNIILQNMDITSLIIECDNHSKNTFFYFDPPYLMSTRKSNKILYKHEWSDKKHEMFLDQCKSIGSNCMISHYPCELYNAELKDWYTFDFQSHTRQGMAVERIYMNYDTPTILQDYRYLGVDATDRQRIKRKASRFVNKIQQLPQAERQAILLAIKDKYDFT